MKTHDSFLLLAVICFAASTLILAAVFDDCATTADAQDSITETLALARTGVREAGVAAYRRDDIVAIDAVIRFRARHLGRRNYLSTLMRYTRGGPVDVEHPRAWIVDLFPSAHEPARWPAHLRWQRGHRQAWRRTYQAAGWARRASEPLRCRVPGPEDAYLAPHDWGSEHDAIRYRRENPDAIELDCGQTCSLNRDGSQRFTRDGLAKCNHWFHIPRYGARFAAD